MEPLKVLGIITARGGSKGIPRKNIREVGGRPLIAWTIEAAKASQLLTEFFVSTDDVEIAEVAKACGAPAPFMRPAELATDTAKSIDVVQQAIGWFKENQGKEFDAVMILQPTSPLRTAEDIDASVRIMAETGCDSVMSMVELEDFSAKKLKRIEDGKILPWLEEEGKESAQRQTVEAVYKRNCAIYLTKVSSLVRGDLFGSDSRAYVMPRERSVDINSLLDLRLAELLLTERK